jgi:hypothetical protein
MDLQDLLYTNKFVSSDTLREEEETKNYGAFQKYMAENNHPTQRYLQNRTFEDNPVNIQRNIAQKWPVLQNKNVYPTFDRFTDDLVKDTFQKSIITNISVNSRDRDLSKYIYSNDYFIPFPKQFTNIDKLVIKDIIFPNNYPPINNTNNVISWQYASRNELLTYNIDQSIIPQPNIINNIEIQTIFYSQLTSSQIIGENSYVINSVSNTDNSQNLVYQTNVPTGFYTTTQLEQEFERICNRTVHGATYFNQKELELTNITPLNNTNINTLFIPSRSIPWKYIYEEPYYTTQLNVNTPHNFTMNIDTKSQEVKIVNRMEKLPIVAIQTFSALESEYESSDIFYNYSLNPNKGTSNYIDNSYIYITIPYQKHITPFYYAENNSSTFINPFPLVITGLNDNIGNINQDYFNFTTFYDLNIYLQNGYIEVDLDSICTYKYWDTIELVNNEGKIVDRFIRLAFKMSSGTLSTYLYNPYGNLINPTCETSNIYKESLKNYLESKQIYKFNYIKNSELSIGRSMLFRWIFDIDENQYVDYEVEADYEKRRSLLKLLGWSVPNKSYNLTGISNLPIYKFVHSNVQNKVYQEEIEQNVTNTIFMNNSPQRRLNLQLYNNDYYFKSYDYIFLKISPDITKNAIENALIQAQDNTKLNLNSIYITPEDITTGIGENETESSNQIFASPTQYVKDRKELFAKILISPLPAQVDPQLALKDEVVMLYDKPLENVSGIYIEVLSEDSKKLRISTDYSFTLQVYETKGVIKGTNIDTKRNEVFTNGAK